jgi:2-oxoglutarate ferredoxin oxidoreductase subunit beta
MASALVEQYFRQWTLPHIWCPGCGNGILLRDVAQAIDNLGLDRDKVCIFSGIGCSSRAAGYLDFNTMHTTHGRAIAFATGLKMAKPELTVIVLTGDGDACAIGGNHLLHAARRNIDLTVVVFNNRIYGMTGGQYSPTTPSGEIGTTAPYGNIDRVFDLPKVARAAGATYTARGTVYHVPLTVKLIEGAIKNKGFSLVECVTNCPTYYGRKNQKGDAVAMLQWQKDNAIDVKAAARMEPAALQGKLVIGKLSYEPQPELTAEYQKIIDRLRGSENETG